MFVCQISLVALFSSLSVPTFWSSILTLEKRVLLRSAPWWFHQVLILFSKGHLRNILKAMKFCVIILTLLIQPPKENEYQDFCPFHRGMGWEVMLFCVCTLQTWVGWHTRDVYSYTSRWYLSIAQPACESQKTSENLPRIMTCSPRQTYSGCSYQTEFNILY